MKEPRDQRKVKPSRRISAADFLFKAANQYVELSAEDDPFVYLAQRLIELVGDAVVAVSSFHKETSRFSRRCTVQALDKGADRICRDAGELYFEVREGLMRLFASGRLTRVQRRGPRAFPHEFMKEVLSLEETYGSLSLYAVGFGWKDEILGNAVIMVPKTRRLKNRTLVEAFVRLASIATRLSRNEISLRESEAKYRQLVQYAPSGIYEVDFVKGRFVGVNDIMCEYTGYTKEEFLHMSPLDILTEESRAAFVERLNRLRRGESVPETVEFKILGKQGKEFWVILNVRYFWEDDLAKRATVVVHNITDIKEAEQALRDSETRLRLLSSQLINAQEEERKRIARELHDQLGQDLMVLKLQLRSVQQRIERSEPETAQTFEQTLRYINDMAENVRRLSRNLSPAILEDLGLPASVRWLIVENAKHYDLDIQAELQGLDGSFGGEEEIILFRVFQEALTNIGKHAQASQVRIFSQVENGVFSLEVDDNGVGFDAEEALGRSTVRKGFGLTTMHERARMLGGRLQILAQKGAGCNIRLEIPLARSERK
ncbi:MAG: PAS domain S-box protein [Desulfobacterota bacterium]|nr:PAS domain S-box protein [Thermodesulfobacteriota bacterium]